MLSIGTISSAAGASQYYKVGEYYTESPGQSSWHGEAVKALGVSSGPVDPKELENILSGLSADGAPLTKHAASGKTRQLGNDLTFTVPKSVSILMQGEHGPQILKLVRSANHETMSQVQSHFAQTRMTDKDTGKRNYVSGQKIAYLSIEEHTSRANDPNFHIHNVVPNLVLCDDGKFKALHNTLTFRHQKLIGAIFRAELAKGLRGMGLELEPAGKHGLFEVKSVPTQLRALFSKRRQQMEELYKDSQKDKCAMDRIALISRPSKDNLPLAELRQGWDKELKTLGTSFEKISKEAFEHGPSPQPLRPTRSPHQLLKDVVGDLCNRKRAWTQFEVLSGALLKGVPEITARELQAEMNQAVKASKLLKESSYYTVPSVLKAERAVMEQWQRGQLRGAVIAEQAPSQIMDGFKPTSGQQEAADMIVSARDRVVGVQGDAGVGKTTLVKLAAPVIKGKGYELVGIAPTSNAVSELEKEKIFDKVMTSQQYCLTPYGDENTVLLVDESSMLGTKSMLNILNYANSRRLAKVILMGDVNQLGSIEAGTPFADLQKTGMRTALVDEIIRQKDSRHRQAVSEMAKGNVRAGLRLYAPEIHVTERGTMSDQAADMWKQTGDPRTPVIVQTNAQKIEINNTIKAAHNPVGRGVRHKIWRPVHMNASERARTETYEAGTHIRFNRDLKRFKIKRGQIFKIDEINTAQSVIKLSSGLTKRTFLPAQYALGDGTVELYEQSVVTLHKDDRIRFTRGGRSRAVNNNDLGFVRRIDDRKVTIEFDKGERLTLPLRAPELRHMDHGWATTCHAYQGKTVENAVVVMPSYANPLTTLKSLYTGTSRHKDGVALITDDKQRLRASIEQSLDISLALSKAFRPAAELKGNDPTGTTQDARQEQGPSPMDRSGTFCLDGQPEKTIDDQSEPDLKPAVDRANDPKQERSDHSYASPEAAREAAIKAWSDSLDKREANLPDRAKERNGQNYDFER
jgi:conjugative relaxase-like TrwC/TraI family protein